MFVKLLTEHHLEFLSLKMGSRGSSESTHVKLLEISCSGSIFFSCYFRVLNRINNSRSQIPTTKSRPGMLRTTVKPALSGHSKRRPKLFFKTDCCLMQVKSIAECFKRSILQYFRPSLSYHMSLISLLCLFLSGRLRQVLLYIEEEVNRYELQF